MQKLTLIQSSKVDLSIKYNGRSSDYIFPSIINGCAYDCSYCYMKRHNPDEIRVYNNWKDMFSKTTELLKTLPFPKIPNQCDYKYYTFDIGTNTDIPLMYKYLDIDFIWNYFIQSEKGKAVFATKFVNKNLLLHDPKGKVRIRFSLMPQPVSSVFEPKTSLISDRILAVKDFIEAGYEVHLNFSPVIWNYDEYEQWYLDLFTEVNDIIPSKYKNSVHCEVIFLTHSKKMHEYNVSRKSLKESLLWNPEIQESKTTSYGGDAVRYKYQLKNQLVNQFKELHGSVIPWNKIRYIF